MRRITIFALAVAATAAFTAQNAAAQSITIREGGRRGWLGFSYDMTTRARPGMETSTIIVREIVDQSPAQRAGLASGDTLVSINGLTASEQLISSLGYSLAPGDTVTVRVRRAGRARDFTVVAAARPAEYVSVGPDTRIITFDNDSIRGMLRVYLDSARARLDTLRIPNIRVQRWSGISGDSTRWQMFSDSFVLRMDTLNNRVFRLYGDSMRLQLDSVWTRFAPNGDFRLHFDSLRTMRFDSLSNYLEIPTRTYSMRVDSMWRGFAGDNAWDVMVLGGRGIAGAQLTEITEGLGEYFGTEEGALVVKVPEGTPADRSGLLEGDVIVKANGQAVGTIAELRRAIARAPRGEPVSLEVIRRKSRRTIELKRD
jgi:membrane-associated protease RseP (regulator of RpoE activity)